MNSRKRIAVITTSPDDIYQQEVLKGVFEGCTEYGYDAAVITSLIKTEHYFELYVKGAVNIFKLINPDLFDGIIIATLTLQSELMPDLGDRLLEIFKSAGYKNVISLDKPFGDYPVQYVDDRTPFYEISEHIFEKHGCTDVYFLSGPKDGDSSSRLEGYKDYLDDHGIIYDENKVFYGDFWYSSGEKLADDIHSGSVRKPQAVICASDHMAIGLVNRLVNHGIKVPEDIIVTGFDSTHEGALNKISITSYNPKIFENAMNAVHRLHSLIEPDAPRGKDKFFGHSLIPGDSCGCCENTIRYFRESFRSHLVMLNHNFGSDSPDVPYDLGNLLESYISELLIRAQDEKNCLIDIVSSAYFLKPMENFYICLRKDWKYSDDSYSNGYPDRIMLAARKCFNDDSKSKYGINDPDEDSFDTSLMLPDMHEAHEEPLVYYFMPLHSENFNFGYSVLSRKLSQPYVLGEVEKLWIRYVNTALETTKIRTRIYKNTITDVPTGLLNRYGMYSMVAEKRQTLEADNQYRKKEGMEQRKVSIAVIMIDMDGLKKINDTYGHSEGDYGIKLIADALISGRCRDDLAVRNGGDEFLYILISDADGKNSPEKRVLERITEIEKYITEHSETSGKPYTVSASFGYSLAAFDETTDLDRLIKEADEMMYTSKKKKKAERKD